MRSALCTSATVDRRPEESPLADMPGLAGVLRPRQLDHDEFLFLEGDAAEKLYLVRAGVVRSFKLLPDGRRQITGFHFRGDVVGFPYEGRYLYSAEAATISSAYPIARQRLPYLTTQCPELRTHLDFCAANELHTAQEHVMLLGRKSAPERLASFVMQLSQRAERRGEPPNPLWFPLKLQDIGDYLGLATETVCRAMGCLQDAALVEQSHGRLAIRDGEGLQNVAAGYGGSEYLRQLARRQDRRRGTKKAP